MDILSYFATHIPYDVFIGLIFDIIRHPLNVSTTIYLRKVFFLILSCVV